MLYTSHVRSEIQTYIVWGSKNLGTLLGLGNVACTGWLRVGTRIIFLTAGTVYNTSNSLRSKAKWPSSPIDRNIDSHISHKSQSCKMSWLFFNQPLAPGQKTSGCCQSVYSDAEQY